MASPGFCQLRVSLLLGANNSHAWEGLDCVVLCP